MQTPAQCGVVSLTHFLEQLVTDITACNLTVCTGHILRTMLEGEGERWRGEGEGEGERGRYIYVMTTTLVNRWVWPD